MNHSINSSNCMPIFSSAVEQQLKQLATRVQTAAQAGLALVRIDGRCGSGKSTLAHALIRQITAFCPDAVLLHTDDFTLPPALRGSQHHTPCVPHMDFDRLAQTICPLLEGKPTWYQPFSCQAGKLGGIIRLFPSRVVVLEGSYALHPAVISTISRFPNATLAICFVDVFVNVSGAEQIKRLKEREGTHFAAFETRWIPAEEIYFAQAQMPGNGQWVIDTTPQ